MENKARKLISNYLLLAAAGMAIMVAVVLLAI